MTTDQMLAEAAERRRIARDALRMSDLLHQAVERERLREHAALLEGQAAQLEAEARATLVQS